MSIKILGYCAIALAACAAIPQLIQIIKTKQVRDLNPIYFCIESIASFLYILYGFLSKDYIMMGSAIMPFTSQLIIIILYFCFKNDDT
jgi:uncharacterized protein with PQ loop repeat